LGDQFWADFPLSGIHSRKEIGRKAAWHNKRLIDNYSDFGIAYEIHVSPE
jgi:hypothetical protein